MNKIKDIIATCPLFSGLPDKQLDALGKISIVEQYKKGDTIFSEGETGRGFFIAESGSIKIYKLSFDGKEQILHIFGPGEPFGEVPVFTGKPFPANAMALKVSRVLFFPRSTFIELLSRDPSLALNMLGVLALRLRQFTVQIENLSLKEVPGRLAAHLVWLAKDQKNHDNVVLDISKGQLASLLGTIPETLSRILSKMAGMNIIDVQGRDIRILNYDGLKELADFGKLEV
ncbi:MAG: Crp/Fnr family transcriptional regulator [Proteobacteria bacterium]|nr:Crp/Fnr family transcriptional regulator [Pseudomonadota bacterium]